MYLSTAVHRSIDIDMNKVLAFDIGINRKRVFPYDTSSIAQTNLQTTPFKIGEDVLTLKDFRSISLYNLINGTKTNTHQHAPIFDTLSPQPNWTNLPNRRQHPTLSYELKEIRFKTMHNRHYIGRQRIHLPDAPAGIELCPRCSNENNILHLILNCPVVTEAWRLLQLEWEILLQSYKDSSFEITGNNWRSGCLFRRF